MHPKLLAFVMIPDEEWDSTKEVTRLPSLFLLAESWGNEIVYAELEEDVDGSSKPQLSFSSYLASISPNFNKPQKKKRIDALVRLRDLFHSNYYPSLVQWWIFSLHKKAKKYMIGVQNPPGGKEWEAGTTAKKEEGSHFLGIQIDSSTPTQALLCFLPGHPEWSTQ